MSAVIHGEVNLIILLKRRKRRVMLWLRDYCPDSCLGSLCTFTSGGSGTAVCMCVYCAVLCVCVCTACTVVLGKEEEEGWWWWWGGRWEEGVREALIKRHLCVQKPQKCINKIAFTGVGSLRGFAVGEIVRACGRLWSGPRRQNQHSRVSGHHQKPALGHKKTFKTQSA